MKGTVNSLRDELEKTQIGREEEVQRAVAKSNDENVQLKDTVNNLRDTLEKTQIDIEERIQKSVAVSNDENKQLKGTVNSLRDELEKTQIGREEEVQRAVASLMMKMFSLKIQLITCGIHWRRRRLILRSVSRSL